MVMNIQKLHIDEIRPYWRNPRKNDKAVESVKHSINKYGYNSPIVVDKNHTIIAGHTRYKALRELGYTDVEVVIKHLSEEKAKEYRIADNKTSEKSSWDEDLLLYELREIEDLNDMQIFFDKGELDELLEIQGMDFDDSDNFNINEEERKAVEVQVKAQLREEIGEEYEEEYKKRSEELEKQVEDRVQERLREREREALEEENAKIKKLEEDRQNKFPQISEDKGDDYIEIQCPHCDEKYVLSKSQLLNAGKVRRTF